MTTLENSTPPWADGNDDDGTLTEGTALDASLFDGFRDSIDFLTHSTTNPTIKPKDIIDEVEAARGATADLSARLATVISATGTLNQQGLALGNDVIDLAGGIPNWIYNDDFRLWSLGDTSAPDGWTLAGAGAAIQRCGTGLADTQRFGLGDFVVRLTFGAAALTLTQDIIPAGTIATRALQLLRQATVILPGPQSIGGDKAFGIGVACFASTANQASMTVANGAGGGATTEHTGDGTWQVLVGVAEPAGGATSLSVSLKVNIAGGPVYFSAPFLIPLSQNMTEEYQASPKLFALTGPWRLKPCPMVRKTFDVPLLAGAQTVRNNIWRHQPRRPCIITDVQLSATTGPTITALIYDLKSWDGAAFTSMFSALPQIAAGQTRGGAQPDGTYARRCLNPYFGTAIAAGGEIRLDCTQIGTVAGADVCVTIGYMEYARPLEGFYDYNTE